MHSRPATLLQRLRFTVGMLAMVVAMWAAIDMHSHETGLHAPVVCNVCALEKATGSGFAPAQAIAAEAAIAAGDVRLPEQRMHTVACRHRAPIRAPPLV
ncbi:MAG TPA: hypothetical protein VNI58_05450 [Mariprofundaceae bacterium]|nr:hypothetical protein [Mariprofundaceae bacterium]